jgi:serine protease Do
VSSVTGRGPRLFLNFLWLGTLLVLVLGIVLVWRKGGEWFAPNLRNPVVELFRRASPGVVSIQAGPAPGRVSPYGKEIEPNQGSGTIVDPRGYILTNEHVVRDADVIKVVLADGRTVDAALWATEPSLDLAVVKVDVAGELPSLTIRPTGDLMIGQDIIVIGSPFGEGLTCTKGIISALHRSVTIGDQTYYDLIQIDAALNRGNSGGPLLDERGDLIGITSALKEDAQGIGFAIPAGRLKQAVAELITYRYIPTGWLGISVMAVSGREGAFGPNAKGGVFISGIESDGPSAGKLHAGDVLEKWDGVPLETLDDFVLRARMLEVEQKVVFTCNRNEEHVRVEVVAKAFPERLAEDWAWAALGIRVREDMIYEPDVVTNKTWVHNAVFIKEVAPRSPAASFGLAPGDCIRQMKQMRINRRDDFLRAIVQLRGGNGITFVTSRGPMKMRPTVPVRPSGERW